LRVGVGFWLLAFGFWWNDFPDNIIMPDLHHLNMALTKVLIAKGQQPTATN